MFSVNDFLTKFEQNSDSELMSVTDNPGSYSEEAVEAANIMIRKRGGRDMLLRNLAAQKEKAREIQRIKNEVSNSGRDGFDTSFIKAAAKSNILSGKEVDEIIDDQYEIFEAEQEDRKVTEKTIGGAILGCITATLICGIPFGLLLIYTGSYSPFLFAGMALICYSVIRFITKKSKNNLAVIIATALAFILSAVLGYFLYAVFGYRG